MNLALGFLPVIHWIATRVNPICPPAIELMTAVLIYKRQNIPETCDRLARHAANGYPLQLILHFIAKHKTLNVQHSNLNTLLVVWGFKMSWPPWPKLAAVQRVALTCTYPEPQMSHWRSVACGVSGPQNQTCSRTNASKKHKQLSHRFPSGATRFPPSLTTGKYPKPQLKNPLSHGESSASEWSLVSHQ